MHGAEVSREPDGSVRLRMPSAEWSCGLRLEPPAGRRSLDLSGGKWLAVDVENLSPGRQMRLTMHVSSGGADSESADHAVANFTKNRAVNTGIGLNPGRLYLGCRLVGFRQDAAVWDAAARHCDVVSVNAYANSIANLPKAAAGCGKPILLGEFHFGCLDRGMFRASLCPVADQAERARSYARLVQGALSHPALVGCHWFQYRDQPLVGRGDGEAYQCGFVDVVDRPYAELCAAAREIGETMYPLRAGAARP